MVDIYSRFVLNSINVSPWTILQKGLESEKDAFHWLFKHFRANGFGHVELENHSFESPIYNIVGNLAWQFKFEFVEDNEWDVVKL